MRGHRTTGLALLLAMPTLAAAAGGDGGLAELMGVIGQESAQTSHLCRGSSLTLDLQAQESALSQIDGMGCKALTGRLKRLDALAAQAGSCGSDELSSQARQLGQQYRAAESARCQGNSLNGVGQAIAVTGIGMDTLTEQRKRRNRGATPNSPAYSASALLTPRFMAAPQCPQRTLLTIPRAAYERYPYRTVEFAPERCTKPRETFTGSASTYWRLMQQYYPFKADGRGRKTDGDYGSPGWATWMADRILSAKEPPLGGGSLQTQATPAHLKDGLQRVALEGDGALCELERQMDIQKGAGGHAEDYAIVRAEYNMQIAKADLKTCMLLTLPFEPAP